MTRMMMEFPADWLEGEATAPLTLERAFPAYVRRSEQMLRNEPVTRMWDVVFRFRPDPSRAPVRIRPDPQVPLEARLPLGGRAQTVVLCGEIPGDFPSAEVRAWLAHRGVGVHSDPVIGNFASTLEGPAVGTHGDIWKLLGGRELANRGLDGQGVHLAIVDNGLNLASLASPSEPAFATRGNWSPPGTTPGRLPENHGSMCAFDARLLAPRATLIDCAVTHGLPTFDKLLSNALIAYEGLVELLRDLPNAAKALVVNNSWGLKRASDDPSKSYSDDPNHVFTKKVRELTTAGADIVFAAGNFGESAEAHAVGFDDRPICGANSDASVLTVAGVYVHKDRVPYSSRGPGRLSANKPDLACYTHFWGHVGRESNLHVTPDNGTSAACAVVSGLLAAIRTRYPATVLPPHELRRLLRETARLPPGAAGAALDFGAGVIDVSALLRALPTL